MTAKRPPLDDAGAVELREHGLTLADSLLESGRELRPLSTLAHARVKRRLLASTRRPSFRRVGWLRPVVIVSIGLVCGAAFGVALDRVVIRRGGGVTPTPSEGEGSPVRSRAHSGRSSPKSAETFAVEARGDSSLLGAEPPPSNAGARSATAAEGVAVAEPPLPARVARPPRKPALLAEPSDTSSTQARSDRRESPPVVPAETAASPPPPSTAVGPAPTPDTPIHALPGAMNAPPRSVEPAKAPASRPLSEERLLAAAIRALRAESDPRSALAALDEYQTHYPRGRLFVEAEVLRVDALVALKKTPEVLRTLDGLDFAHMPGGLERQLQRAELRAAAGRQREAEADFASVLLRARDVDLLERALWGRAQSRASLGDAQGARLDASEYVRRFPNGRFATPAARLGSPVTP